MSVYILDMEMPKKCGSCKLVKSFVIDSELVLYCPINGEAYCKERKGCLLVLVSKHGRLIDADEYQAKMRNAYDDDWFTVLENTPTVIPADKE